LDAQHIERARAAARALGLQAVRFVAADVWDYIGRDETFDVVLCTGGLYHLEDPRRLLDRVKNVAAHYLIIQSVVTLETEDPDYFVTPAPGWKHGSRFSHARLRGWLEETGWQIVEQARNELTGNPRRQDRGSSYFLCENSDVRAAS
jgi:hypothetical protein